MAKQRMTTSTAPFQNGQRTRTDKYARGDEKMDMYAQCSELLGTPDGAHREMLHLNCQPLAERMASQTNVLGGYGQLKLSWINYLNINYITIWGTSVAVSCQI